MPSEGNASIISHTGKGRSTPEAHVLEISVILLKYNHSISTYKNSDSRTVLLLHELNCSSRWIALCSVGWYWFLHELEWRWS